MDSTIFGWKWPRRSQRNHFASNLCTFKYKQLFTWDANGFLASATQSHFATRTLSTWSKAKNCNSGKQRTEWRSFKSSCQFMRRCYLKNKGASWLQLKVCQAAQDSVLMWFSYLSHASKQTTIGLPNQKIISSSEKGWFSDHVLWLFLTRSFCCDKERESWDCGPSLHSILEWCARLSALRNQLTNTSTTKNSLKVWTCKYTLQTFQIASDGS